jgi:subtilase family serine protease
VNGPVKVLTPLVVALTVAACNAGGSSSVPSPGQAVTQARSHSAMPEWETKGLARPACPQVVGKPACLTLIQLSHAASPAVAGWAPIDLQTRYNLPSSTNGSGQIVAIVDAYDNPSVASDMAAYRSEFGLGTGNFTKYNQDGKQGNYPRGSTGWGLEIDLDVQMVSATCPNCTIYLIEANSSNTSDLEAADAQAVTLGAHIVSNSWICYDSTDCGDSSISNYFDAPGVIYTAGSGDAGYNQNGAPEALASVVSVGGTVLAKNGSTYSETVWDGAGGGCSNNGSGAGVTKPSWQTDPDCTYRTDSDISAIAWNVAEYDSYGYGGWVTVGGTSVATPITAAVYALAGNAMDRDAGRKFWHEKATRNAKQLNDISSGNDGSCNGEYLCAAGTNQFGVYSGPAGWGTPNGLKAY